MYYGFIFCSLKMTRKRKRKDKEKVENILINWGKNEVVREVPEPKQ